MRFIEFATPVNPQDELDLYLQIAPERFGLMNSQGRVNQQYRPVRRDSLESVHLATRLAT